MVPESSVLGALRLRSNMDACQLTVALNLNAGATAHRLHASLWYWTVILSRTWRFLKLFGVFYHAEFFRFARPSIATLPRPLPFLSRLPTLLSVFLFAASVLLSSAFEDLSGFYCPLTFCAVGFRCLKRLATSCQFCLFSCWHARSPPTHLLRPFPFVRIQAKLFIVHGAGGRGGFSAFFVSHWHRPFCALCVYSTLCTPASFLHDLPFQAFGDEFWFLCFPPRGEVFNYSQMRQFSTTPLILRNLYFVLSCSVGFMQYLNCAPIAIHSRRFYAV